MSTIVKEMLRDYYNLDDSSRFDLDVAIESLVNDGAFNSQELIVLKLTLEGIYYGEIAKAIEEDKSNINKRLNKIADKISTRLGEEYQDKKVLKNVEAKLGRPLTPEEEMFCWKVIKAGRPLKEGLSIFNFKVGKHGRIIERTEGETEGQVGM